MAGDPNWSNVVLLCHCDGTNGSTVFTDASLSAHTLAALGPTTISTASPKFGSGAANIGGASGAVRAVLKLPDFNFGAGQFTVEAQVYFTSAPSGVVGVVTQFGGSSNLGWFLGWNSSALAFFYSTTGTDNPSVGATFSPTLNTWYHIAADRDVSNVLRVYANGAVVASATVSATFYASSRTCQIGNDENANRQFPGQIDEVRVTKGLARYGGAFTPPTAAFPEAGGATGRPIITMVA